MIFETIIILSTILILILILMFTIVLCMDFERDKCEICKIKIEHKGYDFVYCDKCKHKTYTGRI